MLIDELEKLSPEEKKKKKNSLNMELVMLEAEAKKILAKKTELETEIRKLKKEGERIRVESDEKNEELVRVNYDLSENEAEIKGIKKQINVL